MYRCDYLYIHTFINQIHKQRDTTSNNCQHGCLLAVVFAQTWVRCNQNHPPEQGRHVSAKCRQPARPTTVANSARPDATVSLSQ